MSKQRSFFPENPLYFATMTVVGWVDVFTREAYIEELYRSWEYCVTQKGLRIHAYVVMSNHVHWIISTRGLPLSGIVRDTKKFTAKALFNQIKTNPHESRREWMLSMFRFVGKNQVKNKEIQFWQHGNHATDLWSVEVIQQKSVISTKIPYGQAS
ncbi:MAG: transposase [Bacteroidota bacterium]